jgi:hypothetical protein
VRQHAAATRPASSESIKNVPATDKTTPNARSTILTSRLMGAVAMSSTAGWIALVEGDEPLTYLMERYTERSGLGMHVVADPPPATLFDGHLPALVWFPTLDSLARWRGSNHVGSGHDPAVVVCTTVADERRSHELEADYCVLLSLTYDDFRAALSAVGLLTSGPA